MWMYENCQWLWANYNCRIIVAAMSTNSGFTKKCHPHLKQLLKETKNVFKDLVDLTQLNIFTKAYGDSTNVDEDVANGRSTPCYTIKKLPAWAKLWNNNRQVMECLDSLYRSTRGFTLVGTHCNRKAGILMSAHLFLQTQ